MTEQEFNWAVERAADKLETSIEGAADRLDRGLERRWRQRPFRILIKTISATAGLGLVGGAFCLSAAGHKTLARWCFGLGAAGLLAECCKGLFLKRE